MSENFDNSKTYVNLATIGHVDHGKTTLTACISKISYEKYHKESSINYKPLSYTEIDSTPEEGKRGITINAKSLLFETLNRYFSVTDCPGHATFVKNTSAGAQGADIALVAVAGSEGAKEQTKEHLAILDRIRPKSICVAITKIDQAEDLELLDLAEEEVLEMIKDARCSEDPDKKLFEEKNVFSVRVSALKALEGDDEAIEGIMKLLETLDKCEVKERKLDQPFLLSIADTANIQGRGVVVSGVIEQGIVKKGDEVEVFTKKKGLVKYTVTDIETFHHKMDQGEAGQNTALLLRGAQKGDIRRGDVVGATGFIKPATKLKASVYLLDPKKQEGGRRKPIKPGYSPHFFMRCQHVTGKITGFFSKKDPQKKLTQASAGERVIVEVELIHPAFLQPGLGITIREGKEGTIGSGRVIEVL